MLHVGIRWIHHVLHGLEDGAITGQGAGSEQLPGNKGLYLLCSPCQHSVTAGLLLTAHLLLAMGVCTAQCSSTSLHTPCTSAHDADRPSSLARPQVTRVDAYGAYISVTHNGKEVECYLDREEAKVPASALSAEELRDFVGEGEAVPEYIDIVGQVRGRGGEDEEVEGENAGGGGTVRVGARWDGWDGWVLVGCGMSMCWLHKSRAMCRGQACRRPTSEFRD